MELVSGMWSVPRIRGSYVVYLNSLYLSRTSSQPLPWNKRSTPNHASSNIIPREVYAQSHSMNHSKSLYRTVHERQIKPATLRKHNSYPGTDKRSFNRICSDYCCERVCKGKVDAGSWNVTLRNHTGRCWCDPSKPLCRCVLCCLDSFSVKNDVQYHLNHNNWHWLDMITQPVLLASDKSYDIPVASENVPVPGLGSIQSTVLRWTRLQVITSISVAIKRTNASSSFGDCLPWYLAYALTCSAAINATCVVLPPLASRTQQTLSSAPSHHATHIWHWTTRASSSAVRWFGTSCEGYPWTEACAG